MQALAPAVARHEPITAANTCVMHEVGSLLEGLEALYERYNKPEFIHPDPLEFLFRFPDPEEREIVGLIAASLAYGRVWQILKSIDECLEITGRSPRGFLIYSSVQELRRAFKGFNYRFIKGEEMASFMIGIKRAIERHGGLEPLLCLSDHGHSGPDSTVKKLKTAVDELLALSNMEKSYLLPDPGKKSACKRLFLYLRWMVRKDQVDPGGWHVLSPSDLVIPLDTHMHHIALNLGLTDRKQANLKTAIEITRAFRRLTPCDPVRYDFVLTRFGIRPDLSRDEIPAILKRP